MNEQTNTKVITLGDLWGIFLRRLWVLLLVAVITVGATFAGITLTFVPRYESTATLYILQQNQTTPDKNYEDFNLALKVVNDCTHLIKSHSVLDGVIKDLDLDVSYQELYKSIKITNPTDTRILEVVVESDSPQKAKLIVDTICSIGTEKITEAMGFEQVNFYEKGVLNESPSNATSVLTYIIIGVVAMVVTYAVFLIRYILDDNIRTDEDIKNYLGVSILGDIPNYDESRRKKHGRKYYQNRYYKRRYYQGETYGGEGQE